MLPLSLSLRFWLTLPSPLIGKIYLPFFHIFFFIVNSKVSESSVDTPDPAYLIYMCKISDALHCIFECLECFPICTFCFFSNLTNLALKQNKTQTDGENLRTNKKREIEYLSDREGNLINVIDYETCKWLLLVWKIFFGNNLEHFEVIVMP